MSWSLTSASWVLGLQHLFIRFISKRTKTLYLHFGKRNKVWRKRKSLTSRKVHTFQEDTMLCVLATLEEYFERAKAWRGKNKSQLLSSFIKSHIIHWSIQQCLDGLETSSERQVLILKILRDPLHVQSHHQKLGWEYFLWQIF